MDIKAISGRKLRAMVRDTERMSGKSSSAARMLRRELDRRRSAQRKGVKANGK